MTKRVLMLGTFDSKGEEFAFLRERIQACGCEVISVNAGVDVEYRVNKTFARQ